MQKILIVEDEKAISGVLQSILSDELPEYEFVIAEDGLEGYKNIEKEDFALVISDIKMPKLSGTELLKQALQIKPDTTFVMISGHADIDTAALFRKSRRRHDARRNAAQHRDFGNTRACPVFGAHRFAIGAGTSMQIRVI